METQEINDSSVSRLRVTRLGLFLYGSTATSRLPLELDCEVPNQSPGDGGAFVSRHNVVVNLQTLSRRRRLFEFTASESFVHS